MPSAGFMGESVADLILRIIADATEYEAELKNADASLKKSTKSGEEAMKKFSASAENSLKKVIRKMHDLDVVVEATAKKISNVGVGFIKTALIMNGPFLAALAKVSNSNQSVARQFAKINDLVNGIANTMAEIALPHVRQFANGLENVSKKFQEMNPEMKTFIGNLIILRTKIYLVVAGITFVTSAIVKLVWWLIKLGARLAILQLLTTFFATGGGLLILNGLIWLITNAVVYLAGVLGGLLGLLFKLPLLISWIIIKIKTLAVAIWIGLVIAIKAGIAAIGAFFVSLGVVGTVVYVLTAAIMLLAVAWIANWGSIREYTRDSLKWISDQLNSFATALAGWADELLIHGFRVFAFWKLWKEGMNFEEASAKTEEMIVKLRKLLDATPFDPNLDLTKGLNSAEEAVDSLKNKIVELWEAFWAGDPEAKWANITDGFLGGFEEMLKGLEDWGAKARGIATDVSQYMQSAFSDFFFDMFKGELKTLEEYFAAFGNFVLRIIADIISQLITALVIKKLLGAFGAAGQVVGESIGGAMANQATVHEGGLIPVAHSGIAVGERMIRAQVGEGILSRNGMNTLGGEDALDRVNAGNAVGGGLSVNLVQVVKAWDAADVYRNRKVLSAAMIEDLERNGTFRQGMKKFR